MAANRTSPVSHAVLDAATRRRKAAKIIAIASQYADLPKCRVLDVGTGTGHIAAELAKVAKQATSVDRFDERQAKRGYDFEQVVDEHLPFRAGSFDVVVSNHVIEHVADQQLHFDEICRVLKPGGYCYLATPNKWWWRENHFKLPLLGWLPRPLGQAYVRLVRGRDWDVYPLSLGGIRRLNHGRLTMQPQTARLLQQPQTVKLSLPAPVSAVARLIPASWLNSLTGWLPTFIVIMRKPK